MLANFTEETCTGTGDTLALAGATSGMIAFSESYSDGDLVAYVLEDSGGTIKVAGIGAYVSATDDIARNDSWNWNGTVIDDNPSSNIALSGSTHTIRCSANDTVLRKPIPKLFAAAIKCGEGSGNVTFTGFAANIFYCIPFQMRAEMSVTKLGMDVDAAVASSFVRLGIYTMGLNGEPDSLIVDSGAIDTSTTGNKTATVASFKLKAGYYYAVILGDSAIDIQATFNTDISTTFIGHPVGETKPYGLLSGVYTYGALPATAPAVTVNTGNQPPLIWIEE
jgi:hypothetical protein